MDFVDEGRECLHNISDEEREPLDSPEFPPLHSAAELSTSEQRSQQHEASLAEEDVPELAEDDDASEEVNQSEEEDELMDSEPANQSPEIPHEEDDDDDDALSAGDSHFPIQFILVNQLICVNHFNEQPVHQKCAQIPISLY